MVEKVMNKETRRIGKRTLAMFMAIVMCLSLLPMNVLASSDAVELAVGETVQLPGVAWSDNEKHEWYVEDESIVSVNGGYVTGLKAGETTVTHVYYEEIMDEVPVIEEPVIEEPEVPTEEPEAPVEEPEAPAEEPEVPVEEPEAPAEEPEVPAEEPEVPAEEPEAPVEGPEAPAEEPEVPAEEPEAPAEEPEAPAEEPEAPAEEPEAPAEEPEAPAEEPVDLGTETLVLNSPAEEPEAPAEEPEAPAEEPEVPAEEPEAPAEEPEAPAEEPEVPAEEPEVPAEEPEAPAEEPEAPAEEPEVPAEEPEVPAEEPEAPVEEPEVPAEKVIVEIDGYERREESWTVIVTDPAGISGKATHEGVTVTVNAPYGAFPEGTELNIAPVAKEEPTLGEQIFNFFDKLFGNAAEMAEAEEIEDPMEAVRSLLTETFEEIEEESSMVAFDITFTDPESGEELQPADGKTVDVQFTVEEDSALLADGPAALQVYHVHEDAVETIGEEVLAEAGEDVTLEVEAEMFSVYVLSASPRAAAPAEGVVVEIQHRNISDKTEEVYADETITVSGMESLTSAWLKPYAEADTGSWVYYGNSLENGDISLMVEEGQALVDEDGNLVGTSENPIVVIAYYQSTTLVQEVTFFDYDVARPSNVTEFNKSINAAANYKTAQTGDKKFAVGNEERYGFWLISDGDYHDYKLPTQDIAGHNVDANDWNNGDHDHAIQELVVGLGGSNYEEVIFADGIAEPGLFNSENREGKTIYTGETLSFNRVGKDTYEFDSNAINEYRDGNFFPLNDKASSPGSKNEYFGMRLDAEFSVPEGYGETLSYAFTGDDDVWVFIDGHIILDMGGIHGAINGSVTLTEGTGANAGKTVATWKVTGINSNREYVLPVNVYDGQPHVLTVLYMERGGNNSNCKMTIRLPNLVPQESVIVPEDQLETYTFTKTWENLPEGVVAESIEATVSNGAHTYPVTVTASAVTGLRDGSVSVNGNVWTITGKVAKSDADYSVTETAVNGLDFAAGSNRVDDEAVYWTKSGDGTDALINTCAEATTDYTFTKIWNGTPEAGISVTLTDGANNYDFAVNAPAGTVGNYSYEVADMDTRNWTITVSGLPSGKTYSVASENTIGNYTVTNNRADIDDANYWVSAISGNTITNTHYNVVENQGIGSLTIQKSDAAGVLSGVSFTLNGVTKATSSDGKVTFTDIPVGTYELTESAPAGYTAAGPWEVVVSKVADTTADQTTNNDGSITLTYNHTASVAVTGKTLQDGALSVVNVSETRDVTVTKVWADADNQDGKRPASIQVQLKANGANSGAPVTLSADNQWTYTWNGLAKMAAGEEIAYTVVESGVPADYTSTTTGDMATGYTITNSYTPEQTSVTVTKAWNDADNQDGYRPSSVQAQLYANGVAEGDPVALSAANNWSYTWTELAKKAAGADITYTVDEVEVPEEYTKSLSGNAVDGYTITNTHVPEETEVTVTKVWDDADDQDGLRPASISVQLYANGTASGMAVTLSENNNWSYTWTELAKKAGGVDITYTVDEVAVPSGYTKNVDGYTITNSHTPAKTEVSATKVWADNNNEGGLRPTSIQVQLYANGAVSGDPITLNADNGWTYTWEDLDEFANGQTIAYTVDETSVPTGYEKTSVTGNMTDGLTITNTLKRGDFTVVKVDAANASNKLSGAVFTLTNDADSRKVYTATSNASGEAAFADIPYGTYTLVETTAPTDYVKSETQWTVVIGDGSVTIEEKVSVAQKLVSFFAADGKDFTISGSTLTVENTHETGVITVAKIAKEDTTDIGGSYTFGIYTLSGDNTFTKVDDVTVAGNDSSHSNALDTQITYYVRETALAPSGLSKALENYNVATSYDRAQTITGADGNEYVAIGNLTTSGLSVTCTNVYTLKTGSLTVKKLVEDTESTEAFTIQVKLGNGSVAASGTKYVANGLYTFNLADGDSATITGIPYTTAYAVTEQYTEPFGYVVTYSNAAGSISAAESTATVTNSYVTSGFVVNKIDKDSKAGLAGAEFTLYTTYDVNDASNNVVYDVYTTGEGGSLSISNLPAGTYWLKETDAPANYDITDDTVWRITVSASQTENTGAAIKVEKDNTGKNFVATLYNTIVSFFGTKTYTVDPVTIQTAETEEEQTAVLTVENTLIDYSLTISKSVSGTTTDRSYKFNVYAADANGEKGAPVAENVEVKAGSSVTLSNKPTGSEVPAPALVAGTYIVEEVTSDVAVANYTWTGVEFDSQTAVLTEAQRSDSVAAVNSYTRDYGTLVVNKTFSGPADLASNFQITVTDGTTPVTAGLTDAAKNQDGSYTWTFDVMTNVRYDVTESNYDQVGNWSWVSGTISGFATVTTKGGSETVNLNNIYAHDQADLIITKDVTGDLSEETVNRTFEFKVYKAGDRTTEIATVTLPENGSWSKTISVDNNTAYEVVETDGAVTGYIWSVASKTVSATVPVTGSATAAFVNSYEKDFGNGDEIYGDSFTIRKTDGTNALAGAEFVLADGSTEIWRGTTGDSGVLTVVIDDEDIANAKNTANKTYTLTEIAPEGYVGAGPWTVTLTCNKVESTSLKDGKFYYTYTWSVSSVADAKGEQLGQNGVTVVNDLIEGTITVNKIVAGLPESMKNENSYTFNVYNAEKSLVDTLTVNAGSKWTDTTISLPYGEYTIEETNPGNETGYTWSGVSFDKQSVSISEQGQQIAVNATNTYTRDLGSLTVSKAVVIDDLAADLVSEKTYELTISGPADANGEYSDVTFANGVATVTLSDKGSITIENLPTGDYTVTESKDAEVEGLILAVTGSVNGGTAAVADKGLKVSVSKDAASTVAVTNTYTLGSDQDTARFTVSKKNSDTNAAIAGVTFTLYTDKACTNAVAGMSKVTDEKGLAEFVLGDELLSGESAMFYLQETVPAGYVDNGTVWEIKIDKADESGKYEVTLAQAPEGLFYKLYHWFVSIVNKDAVWTENTLVISNEPIDYTINVVKVDENGADLAGSAFNLNGSAMEAVSGSDNQFTASVNYTVTPELTISETTVPTGYTGVADFGLEFVVDKNGVVSELVEKVDSEAVSISKNGDTYTVTVMNTRRPDGPDAIDDTAEFTISKVETNNTENGLAGAQFALLTADEYKKYQADETYTALRTVTSGEDGKVEIAELTTVGDEAESTYYLVETAAPTGFSADSSVWTVTVAKQANDPVYEGTADEGKWIVHKSYSVTDIQLDGQSVLENGAVEISNTRNSYTVTVTKSFSGRAALPESFAIVNSYDATVFTVANAASGDGIETPYTWSMEIPFDTEVTFTEQGYDDEATSGYSVVAVIADNSDVTTDGIVTIPANSDTTVAFANTYEMVFEPANDDVNGSDFSISKTGDYEDGFLAGAEFTLTDENGKAVWTGTTTSEGVLDVTIEGADVVDPKEINAEGETIRTYTLTEVAPTGYTGAGPWTVTISGKESISEDLKDNKFYHIYDWTVESVTLADSDENLLADGVVSILNTRDYGTLAITKIVKGLVGAEAKAQHTFDINVTNGAEIANTYDVAVTGNATASYAETITLPTGAYTVKELEALVDEHSGPAVTWKVNDEAAQAENGEIVIEIVKGAETAVEVTNEYSYDPDQHTVTVNVVKVWEDDNNRDGIRPDSIRVELKDAEGTVIGTEDIGADGTATFEFDPYYNEYKKDYVVTEIGYTVDGEYVEGEIPGYTASVDGYTVTNTHEIETVDISIEKVWKDKSNKSIVVRLLADGVEVASAQMDGKVDDVEAEAWKVEFENLPKNDDGAVIDYTVTEDSIGLNWRYRVIETEGEDGSISFVVENSKLPDDDEEEEEEIIIDIPDDDTPTTDIPEEEVPTAEPPKTSDSMIVWVLAAAISGLGLVWLALSGKKREDEESI